jgi:hypothetical protein
MATAGTIRGAVLAAEVTHAIPAPRRQLLKYFDLSIERRPLRGAFLSDPFQRIGARHLHEAVARLLALDN